MAGSERARAISWERSSICRRLSNSIATQRLPVCPRARGPGTAVSPLAHGRPAPTPPVGGKERRSGGLPARARRGRPVVFALEALDTACGVHELLLAREERVAL